MSSVESWSKGGLTRRLCSDKPVVPKGYGLEQPGKLQVMFFQGEWLMKKSKKEPRKEIKRRQDADQDSRFDEEPEEKRRSRDEEVEKKE